jgi:hypothetical protein
MERREKGTERDMDGDNVRSAASGLERLIEIGLALSAERNHDRLTERILLEAIDITNSDGGTLYLRTEENTLKFVIVRTGSLKIAMGGTTGIPIPFPPVRMYKADTNEPNFSNVSAACALTKEAINIEDAYTAEGFDFTGTKKFDQGTGYRSKSFLCIPLKNYTQDVTPRTSPAFCSSSMRRTATATSSRSRRKFSAPSKPWPHRPRSRSTTRT